MFEGAFANDKIKAAGDSDGARDGNLQVLSHLL